MATYRSGPERSPSRAIRRPRPRRRRQQRRCVMNVFMTGATGVIGRRAIPMLRRGGHSVTAAVHAEGSQQRLAQLGVTSIVADLFDRDRLGAGDARSRRSDQSRNPHPPFESADVPARRLAGKRSTSGVTHQPRLWTPLSPAVSRGSFRSRSRPCTLTPPTAGSTRGRRSARSVQPNAGGCGSVGRPVSGTDA